MKKTKKPSTTDFSPYEYSYEYYEDVCYDFGYGNDAYTRKLYSFSGNANIDHYDEHLSRWTENDIARDINEGHPTPVALTLFTLGDLVMLPPHRHWRRDVLDEKNSSSSPNVGMIIELCLEEDAALVIDGDCGRRRWFKMWELERLNYAK